MARNPLLKDKPTAGNNRAGKNGQDNGNWPEAHILKDALYRYSKERLPLSRRIKRLHHEFSLDIGLTLLKNLNKHFQIPSSRKAQKGMIATQTILNEMAKDPSGRRGIGAMQTSLAIAGTPLPRSVIRDVVRTNDPDGVEARYPGRKPQAIVRGKLVAIGPMYEVHCDGHDKLGAFALQMGGVGLPIYGYKDKCSSLCPQLVTIPNNRKTEIVGHTYCDLVSELGCIPLQLTFDKGSETGELYAMQTAFREVYAPNIDPVAYPPCHAMKSVHNIPIESFWHVFREHTGRNLHMAIVQGKHDGIFHCNDELHEHIFYWIWPRIVQQELNSFRDYWNMHKIRFQRNKLMPSGTTPTDLWISPEDFGHERISIPVPRDAVETMRRKRLPSSRDAAYSWVDQDFAKRAEQAYDLLGCPLLAKETGWDVFVSSS
ncbi:uncharacterized protein B0H18DRAFT_1124196 [Fomitopsis serialis]|uniref:uncharacterized protein n=1 Tax=Fomitopsis serialis TaxID=139415 RepID=UPI0020083DB8|nr:uncharacterized protein B0H18DRAFT_1124196 [Neoantrodia serialis]KAH9916465.1 hypothetical protein B0H18DRAFT_1124196 [Neoantrodia serialis]